MSVLFKLLNLIVIIQQVISATDVKQYTTPGIHTVTIPPDSVGVTMSMWGAGGTSTSIKSISSSNYARIYPGGSGAFVSCTINPPPGSTIYLLVGGGGAVGDYGRSTSSAIGGGG
jgi:hypothetical protein